MADTFGQAELLEGRNRIPPADDAKGPAFGHGLGHRPGALGKGREFKDTHRAVPYHQAGPLEGLPKGLRGARADVQDAPAGRYLFHRHDSVLSVGGKALGNDDIHRQVEAHARGLGLGEDFPGCLQRLILHQGIANRMALGLEEGVGHTAADEQGIGPAEEVTDDPDLVRDLGPAQDDDKGVLRCLQRLSQGF